MIRKFWDAVEEVRREAGRPIQPTIRRAWSAVVITNPQAGRFADDLADLIALGEDLGGILAARCIALLGVAGTEVHSFGKAAVVGEDGELEHAAALLHPKMGAPVRAALGKGPALIPSAKKRGAMGTAIDVPLGHKDAAFVRSHFDAIEARVPDAPRRDEIVLVLALTTGGRPLPRIGGLRVEEITGEDGLR
jgi:hypothetical protein